MNSAGRTPWNVVNWKVVVKGLPSGVNALPSALQLNTAWSVSKLQCRRSHRCAGGVAGPMTGAETGAAGPPRRPGAAPVPINRFVPSAVFDTPIHA